MSGVFANAGYILKSLAHPAEETVISVSEMRPSRETGIDETLRTGSKGKAGATAVSPLAKADMVISPAFKFVVLVVVGLVLVLILSLVLIGIFGNSANEQLKALSSVMTTLLTGSFGTILGLIGGKSVK